MHRVLLHTATIYNHTTNVSEKLARGHSAPIVWPSTTDTLRQLELELLNYDLAA